MQINEFSFGGIESGTFGITCGTERHFILPEKRRYVQDVIGMDGVVDFEIAGYDVRVITLPLYFDGDYAELRMNRERIIAWLYNGGAAKRLVFGNQSDRYYLAKVYAALDFENNKSGHIGDIQFECNPPWQFYLNGTELTPEMMEWVNCNIEPNQFVKVFTEPGTMRFVNKGNPFKPVIHIIGNIKSGMLLSYGEEYFQINKNVLFDGIAVDCENETVTRLSDGMNLYPYIDEINNTFFEFESGDISLYFAQQNLGEYPDYVTVIVKTDIPTGG